MLSALGNFWKLFNRDEQKHRELQELTENERTFLNNLTEKELSADSANYCNRNEESIGAIRRRGTITRLDNNCGFINETIYFDLKVAGPVVSELTEGCEVDYLLYRNPRTEHLKAVKIEGVIDQYWDTQEYIEDETEDKADANSVLENFATTQRNIPGLIVGVKQKRVVVKTENDTIDLDLNIVKCDYKPEKGDRVYLCSKVQSEEGYVHRHEKILKVIGLFPFRLLKDEKCKVTAVNDNWAALNHVYYLSFDILRNDFKLTVGDRVFADVIECEHGQFSWRCINFAPMKKYKVIEQVKGSSHYNGKHLVTVTKDQYCVFGGLNQEQTVVMSVFNNSHRSMTANSVCFSNQKTSSSMVSLTDSNIENGFKVPSKRTFVLEFRVRSKFFGESRETFVMNFGSIRIKRAIIVKVCENEDKANIFRKENAKNQKSNDLIINGLPYNHTRDYANKVWSQENPVIPGVGLLKRRRFIAIRIPAYDVPVPLRDAYLCNDNLTNVKDHVESIYPCLRDELSYENYVQRFQILMYLEEIECFYNFRNYDLDRANFTQEGEYLALTIENLSEKRPSLTIGDIVNAINPIVKDTAKYQGYIHKILGDKILLKFDPTFHTTYRNEYYRLEFFFSRFTYRKCHFALKLVARDLGEHFLFPVSLSKRQSPTLNVIIDEELNMHLNDKPLHWINPCLNEFQRHAVYNILRGEALNMPYVVFGPPGTGKTLTIVEAILQILTHIKSSHIIVATPSNSSANLIATRLIQSGKVGPGSLVRVVSHSQLEQDLIPKHLMPYCATVDAGMDGTCKNEMTITDSGVKLRCQKNYLARYKITLGTCVTLGNYMLLNFPPNHFSHIFVDEAGQCLEPELMVALTQVSQSSGQVILSGDPHQLQPIVICRYAESLGLSLSFLERILDRPPYRKDKKLFPNTFGYNPLLVTKLLHNYRAVPSILKVYNDLFYDSELIPILKEHSTADLLLKLFSESSKRPKYHGTFFVGIRGENSQDKDSPSWYNVLEAKNLLSMTIKLYGENISATDIGIITPYALQKKYLLNMFSTLHFPVPKIGTVEEFQGQERNIILISTVRSSSSQIAHDLKFSLGFVRSKKRFNVAISRARHLLVVFGNPDLLCQDLYWRKYIKYCVANNAYEGCDLPEGFNAMVDNENYHH